MSTPINDGGPAFPNVPSNPDYESWDSGMTLRDYFAGQALAVVQKAHTDATGMPADWEACALGAYALADAMLAERAKGGSR